MTIRRALLPSELPDEATTITASDWQIVQVNGETKLRRIRPGVLPAKSIGAAEIDDKAVTRTQIADSTIQVLQLADDAVETAKIKDKAVSLAKLVDITGYRLLGRSLATTGQAQEVTCTSFAFTFLKDSSDDATACATLGAARLAGATFTGTVQRTNGMYMLAPGVSDDPVYAYQGDTNTGICFPAADTVGFATGGTGRGYFTNSGLFPGTGNTYTFGNSGNRWNYLYCQYINATESITCKSLTETSDARLKTDVVTCDLGLSFIQSLRPVSYRWIIGDTILMPPEDPEDPSALPISVARPGVRRHYGLIAQELRDALDGKDFAGYCYDSEADEYGIRYGELIAPLIKAVQELAGQVEALTARVNALQQA